MGTQEWLVGTAIDWNVGSAEFNGIERVARGLLNFDISGDRRDCDQANFRGAESHDERDGIVRGNVGVDQEGARHPRRIANRGSDESHSTSRKTWRPRVRTRNLNTGRLRFGTGRFSHRLQRIGLRSLEWRFKASLISSGANIADSQLSYGSVRATPQGNPGIVGIGSEPVRFDSDRATRCALVFRGKPGPGEIAGPGGLSHIAGLGTRFAGRPVSAASVYLRVEGGAQPLTARTDSTGTYRFSALVKAFIHACRDGRIRQGKFRPLRPWRKEAKTVDLTLGPQKGSDLENNGRGRHASVLR